jgi:hypothetical protein
VGGARRTEKKLKTPLKKMRDKNAVGSLPAQPKTPPAQNRGIGLVTSSMGGVWARKTPPGLMAEIRPARENFKNTKTSKTS